MTDQLIDKWWSKQKKNFINDWMTIIEIQITKPIDQKKIQWYHWWWINHKTRYRKFHIFVWRFFFFVFLRVLRSTRKWGYTLKRISNIHMCSLGVFWVQKRSREKSTVIFKFMIDLYSFIYLLLSTFFSGSGYSEEKKI